jgi:hypothetical protein
VSGIKVEVLALGTGILLALLGALWKACGLQGDLNYKWKDRIGLAEDGLGTKAGRALIHLNDQVSELLLANEGERFNPRKLLAEPAQLRASVDRFLYLLNVRSKLVKRFHLLLLVGPILRGGLVLGVLSTLAFFSESGHVVKLKFLYPTALALGCPACAAVGAGFFLYMYLEQRLSKAEILSAAESWNV